MLITVIYRVVFVATSVILHNYNSKKIKKEGYIYIYIYIFIYIYIYIYIYLYYIYRFD